MLSNNIDPNNVKREEKEIAKNKFGFWFERYIVETELAESTKAVRLRTYKKNIQGSFADKDMADITSHDVRILCDAVANRGAQAIAVISFKLISTVFNFAINKGLQADNPTNRIITASIGKVKPVTVH